MKKILILSIISVLIIPQITLAAWWNPFTWKIFKTKEPIPQVQVETQKTPEEKISELQKQLDDLKKQQPDSTMTETPVKSISQIVSKKIYDLTDTDTYETTSEWYPGKILIVPSYAERIRMATMVCNLIESDIKNSDPAYKNFPYCSEGKGPGGVSIKSHLKDIQDSRNSKKDTSEAWRKIIGFRSYGMSELNDYIKNESTTSIVSNNNQPVKPVETQKNIAQPILPPTAKQIASLTRICSFAISKGELMDICNPTSGSVYNAYYTSLSFRNQFDNLIVPQFDAMIATQLTAKQLQQTNCDYTRTSKLMSQMTPWAGTLALKEACGTATDGDRINYGMSELQHQLSGLKDTINKNQAQALQRADLERLQKQNKDLMNSYSQSNSWTAIFENNGGKVFNSTGQSFNFNCTGNTCITY